MRKFKICVVGAGLIGQKHVELAQAQDCLAAIVDPSPAAETLASGLGVPYFEDLSKCLSKADIDGVIVASPNNLHLEHGLICLDAGRPVLIEKPLAPTVLDALTLVAKSHETDVPILVGHHRRHSNIIRAAKAILEQEQLGRVVSVNAIFWLNKPKDYFAMEWRKKHGAGPTYINLIHDIDLLQHLCGPLASVHASESNAVRGFEVEDTTALILNFANGALGAATVSDTVSAPWSWELTSGENPAYPKTDQSCYMIGGTEGSLSLPDLRVWSHRGPQSWWSPMDVKNVPSMPNDPVKSQFVHFLEVIDGAKAPLVSGADGLRNIEVLEAIKRAALSGQVESV